MRKAAFDSSLGGQLGALMGWLILGVVAMVVGFAIYSSVSLGKEHQNLESELRSRLASYEGAKQTFLASAFPDSPVHPCKIGGQESVIATPKDQSLRLVQFSGPPTVRPLGAQISPHRVWNDFRVESDREFTFDEIRAVAFEQGEIVETYNRVVTTPVAVAKKKSAIGRGLVGGVLLGPAGMVLGAASGVSQTTQIKHIKTVEVAERTVAGPPTVVLTTKDRHSLFVKIEMGSADEARAWVLWIGDLLAA